MSDQDLLRLKEANEAKWKFSKSFDRSPESYRAHNTSEPLTESIMKMRSKPGSALLIKQIKKSCPSPLAAAKEVLEDKKPEIEKSGNAEADLAPTILPSAPPMDVCNEAEEAFLIPNEQIPESPAVSQEQPMLAKKGCSKYPCKACSSCCRNPHLIGYHCLPIVARFPYLKIMRSHISYFRTWQHCLC